MYGKIKRYATLKLSTRFTDENLKSLAEEKTRSILIEYLSNFANDAKKAFSSKELEKFKTQYGFDEVTIFETEAVVKYPLNKDFKFEYLKDIVDDGIKKIVSTHFAIFNNDPKLAFREENKVWFNAENKIAIKSVRCRTGRTSLKPLHKNELGKDIDFVNSGNNHHIAIYKDSDGKFYENSVSFSEAFKRKFNDLPVIVKNPKQTWDAIIITGFDNQEILENLPKDNWEFVTSLQQNEMFIIGLTEEELLKNIAVKKLNLISKCLYRVQKITVGDYFFRHHLETKLIDSKESKEIKRFIRVSTSSFKLLNAIKVKLNNLGNIQKVGE